MPTDFDEGQLEIILMRGYDHALDRLETIFMPVVIVGLLLFLSMPLYALGDIDREQLEQRIRPIGKVHVQEASSSGTISTPTVKEKKVVKEEPGAHIYEQYCVVCHRDGIAGAPKFRDAGDWAPRLANQTMDGLVAIAIKGLNAMPAKGTCQECSEADIKEAVEYMVPK